MSNDDDPIEELKREIKENQEARRKYKRDAARIYRAKHSKNPEWRKRVNELSLKSI